MEVCDDPDYLIYSCIGSGRKMQRAYDCVRIFFTGENRPPDWSDCDWAFTFEDTSHPRHFRLPLWGTYADPRDLVKPPDHDAAAVLAGKANGGHATFRTAQKAMTSVKDIQYKPITANRAAYDRLYRLYRQMHDAMGGVNKSADLGNVMKELLAIKERAAS